MIVYCFLFHTLVLFVYNFRWSVSVNTEQKVPWIPTCQENTSPNQCKTGPNSVQCSYDEELHKWPVFSKELPPWSCKTTGMSGRSTFTYLLRASWHIKLWGLYIVPPLISVSCYGLRFLPRLPSCFYPFLFNCVPPGGFWFPLLLFLYGAQVIAMLQSLFWSCLSILSNHLCYFTSF